MYGNACDNGYIPKIFGTITLVYGFRQRRLTRPYDPLRLLAPGLGICLSSIEIKRLQTVVRAFLDTIRYLEITLIP